MLSFRRLTHDDLPLIYAWLRSPHVRRWWEEGGWPEERVVQEFGTMIDGREPVAPYLVLDGETPIGYVQTYRLRDDPEYNQAVGPDDAAAAVDIFIGPETYLYRGVGPAILARFLRDVVFADEGITICLICPAVSNTSAIRAYEKAGFRWVKTVDVPGEEEPEYVMAIDRVSALGGEPRGKDPGTATGSR